MKDSEFSYRYIESILALIQIELVNDFAEKVKDSRSREIEIESTCNFVVLYFKGLKSKFS